MKKVLGPGENCGGPLVCSSCAMKWAQKYHDHNKAWWAKLYRDHAKKLKEKTYTVLSCDQCGWHSEMLSSEDMAELGVPWHCDNCGERVDMFHRGTVCELWEKFPE